MGIGDAVAVGLSATDQIIQNDPAANGKIDVVCNDLQADIFRYDPRINEIIRIDSPFFPTPGARTWIKGIILEPEARRLSHFLCRKKPITENHAISSTIFLLNS